MKIKFKILSLISFLLIIVSCEKDLYEDVIYQEQLKNIKVKSISFDDLKNKFNGLNSKPDIENLTMQSSNHLLLSKGAFSPEVTILTDEIKEISNGNYTSFTMMLATPDTIANNLYNVTIEIINQNITGVFITKYQATDYWMDDKKQPFDGTIFTYKLAGENNSTEGINTKLTQAFHSNPDTNLGGSFNLSGGGGSSTYPTDCNGVVETTIIIEPIICSADEHWPWTPGTCIAEIKARLITTYQYTCVPNNNTNNPGNNPGNNNGSISSGGGLGSISNPPSLTTITLVTPPDCLPSSGDMDMDCLISENEASYITFIASLLPENRQVLKADFALKLNIFNFLVENSFSNEVLEFSLQFIEQARLNPTLNLDFEASTKSPYFIDFSSTSGNTTEEIKFRKIYNILTKSPLFKKLFVNLFGPTPLFKAKFKIANLPLTPTGQLKGKCAFNSTNPTGYNYNEITIDRNHLLNDSDAEIALTILHEAIHAYLNVKLKNPTVGMSLENINNMDFQECINTYYNGFHTAQTQHSFFVEHMIPVMVNVLSELKSELYSYNQISAVENPEPNAFIYAISNTSPPSLNYNNIIPWNWSKYFEYFCTSGLESTNSYIDLYPAESVNLLNKTQYLTIGIFTF